jgi:hypothetical protein
MSMTAFGRVRRRFTQALWNAEDRVGMSPIEETGCGSTTHTGTQSNRKWPAKAGLGETNRRGATGQKPVGYGGGEKDSFWRSQTKQREDKQNQGNSTASQINEPAGKRNGETLVPFLIRVIVRALVEIPISSERRGEQQ